MQYKLVKSKEEALELLEADLITIQCFIEICHKNGWKLDDTLSTNNISTRNPTSKPADLLLNSAIRLVYSKD